MRSRSLAYIAALLLVAACTPAEQQYCERMATPPGNPEYPKCVQYFFDQTALYRADREICEFEADRVYPRALYDYGGTARVHGGFGPYGPYSARTIDIPPDYARNAMVDQLRAQIVGPCMASKGWRDPFNWEAGKGVPVTTRKPSAGALPWIR